jgi:hypothetical protein
VVLNVSQALHYSLGQFLGWCFVTGTLDYLVEDNLNVIVLFAALAVSKVCGNYLKIGVVHGGMEILVNAALDFVAIDWLHHSSSLSTL